MKLPALSIILAGCCAALAGCDDPVDPYPLPEPDTIPPAPITDLVLASRSVSSVVLRWSAPGDDGSVGVAWRYDLRYANDPITAETWSAAHQVGGEPTPAYPGWQQVFEIIRLEEGHTYYFALRTFDDYSNVSELSNVLQAVPQMGADVDPPSAVTDLTAESAGSGSIRLNWTAPGNDGDAGTARGYEIRFSETPLDASNFRTGQALLESPIPLSAGELQSFEVTDLAPGVVYHFGLRAWDDASNVGPVSNFASARTGG